MRIPSKNVKISKWKLLIFNQELTKNGKQTSYNRLCTLKHRIIPMDLIWNRFYDRLSLFWMDLWLGCWANFWRWILYLEIYPDIVFILNFCIDIILLLLVKLVNRKKSSLLRMCLAATIGGCSAVMISLIPWVNSMTHLLASLFLIKALGILLKLIVIPLMLLAAFGRMKWTDLLKQGICFWFITYFVGGLMNSIYYNT